MFYLIFINFFTFIIFGIDKRKAIKNKRRVSENILLITTFLGGTIGSVFGMLIFRHKISKTSFLWKFGLVVLLQIGLIYWFGKITSVQDLI